MADEILETPPETPAPVPAPETPAPIQAAPPAASLVINGEKSEREVELETLLEDTTGKLTEAERGRLEAERLAAEYERENQELKKIPAPPKPPKPKRKHNWFSPVIGAEDDDE